MSGSDVDMAITFAANAQPVPAVVQFAITDDSVSQEPVEVYSYSLSTNTTGVSVGAPTEIRITSDDSKSIKSINSLIMALSTA